MKRIISLGLAALILLGTLTGVLISAAYAAEPNPPEPNPPEQTPEGTETDIDDVLKKQQEQIDKMLALIDQIMESNKPISAGGGLYLEGYKYDGKNLSLLLVDTNCPYQTGKDTFEEFFASLLTANFYPKGDSIAHESDVEILAPTGEKYLRFRVNFPNVSFDGMGTTIKFRMNYMYPDDGEDSVHEYVVSDLTLDRYTPKPDDGSGSVEPDPVIPDPATPYILVQNYSYGESDVSAGSDFALTVNFYNTSANITLENIIMKVEPTSGLSITGASNTYYIPSLANKGSMTKSIPLKCLTSAVPGNESVHITFSYEYVANNTRNTKGSEETISIPIAQTERFEVNLTEYPTMLWPGDNSNAVISYVNKGRADIYNLTATIEGNIDDPNQVQNLGNIKAGDSGTAKFSISSMESGGTVSAVITISYENEKGDVSTITKEFTCEVYDNSGDFVDPGYDPGMDPGFMPPEEETGMRWWQWTLFSVGSLSVGGVSGLWMFLKTKMKREEADDEDI